MLPPQALLQAGVRLFCLDGDALVGLCGLGLQPCDPGRQGLVFVGRLKIGELTSPFSVSCRRSLAAAASASAVTARLSSSSAWASSSAIMSLLASLRPLSLMAAKRSARFWLKSPRMASI